MSWYSLKLKGGFEEFVEDAWQAAWEAANSDTQADSSNAIFRESKPGDSLTLYFTPTAQLLAETFGGKPCQKPAAAGMDLVAGDESAWGIHFPGETPKPAKGRFVKPPADAFEPTQPLDTKPNT